MTRTGKCDVCRARKVKCDERRPMCEACRRVGRECGYSYGRAEVIVVEDPTQFSGHGRAKVAPMVYRMSGGEKGVGLKMVGRKKDGFKCEEGVFGLQVARRGLQDSGFAEAVSRGGLHAFQIRSPEEVLRARFDTVLGCYLQRNSPFVIDSLWAEGIPARVGCSRTFDLAVQAAIDSFHCFQNDTHSTRKAAMISRGKALNVLRKDVENASLSFDLAQAIRMHFYSEIFLDFTNWPLHHLHMKGLFDVLSAGNTTLAVDRGFWIFLQSTYIDEVTEATYRGLPSRFDTPFYLTSILPLSPSLLPTPLSLSRTTFHSFIQFPRLLSLVQHARTTSSSSPTALSQALTLSSTLWTISQTPSLPTLLSHCTSPHPIPPSHPLSSLLPSFLSFSSPSSTMLLLHHWMFTVSLAGVIQTLYKHFPVETTWSDVPPLHAVQREDVRAAEGIAQAVRYVVSGEEGARGALPMMLFRVVGPLQTSVGAWLRACVREAEVKYPFPASEEGGGKKDGGLGLEEAYGAADPRGKAKRMVDWVVEEGRALSERWGFPVVERGQLVRAQEWVAGGVEWHGLEMVDVEGLRGGWKTGVWSRRGEGREEDG